MDNDTVADRIFGAVQKYMARSVASILVRIDALEKISPQRGEKGERGERGEKGETGAQGERGERGEKGETGDRGEKGEVGTKGERGEKGETGAAGKDGANGNDGRDGARGEKGDTGSVGKDGSKGDTGEKGDTGDAGPRGEMGPQGKQGEKGDRGERGEQGFKGEQGLAGPSGAQGLMGPRGEQGPEGKQGLQGLQGEQGLDGRDGVSGRDALHLDVVDLDATKRYQKGTFAKWRGGLVRAFRITDPVLENPNIEQAGWAVIVEGIAQLESSIDEDGIFMFKAITTSGLESIAATRLQQLRYRGVYQATEKYLLGDNVTYKRSTWVARIDNPGTAPGTSKEWTLAVPHGRDGRNGIDTAGPNGSARVDYQQ